MIRTIHLPVATVTYVSNPVVRSTAAGGCGLRCERAVDQKKSYIAWTVDTTRTRHLLLG